MYRDYMEKEAEYKYKAVCILLAIIFLINCGVSIWEMNIPPSMSLLSGYRKPQIRF